jgi:hypothetical protein
VIEQVPGFRVGEIFFPTIQEAQNLELLTLLYPDPAAPNDIAKSVINLIVVHTDEVIAILTQEPKVKTPRKPRCDIGKKRGKKESTSTVPRPFTP